MEEDRAFARIARLFDIGAMGETRVLVAGCGSGGGQVAQQLAMSGIRRFSLFDSDVLKEENVIRHVCGRRYLGQRKIDALADVLRDRNPAVEVAGYFVDLMACKDIENHVRQATVVLLATDNDASRFLLNEVCVRTRTPFVVGRVFTRGIGGEVFAYRPGETGCLGCLEGYLQRTQYRTGIREIDLLTEEEREKIYGLETSEIKDSPGLNVDISFITSFHTRYTLEAIARTLPARPQYMPPIEQNYLLWGNRPVRPFTKHFEIQRVLLRPQEGCLICGKRSA